MKIKKRKWTEVQQNATAMAHLETLRVGADKPKDELRRAAHVRQLVSSRPQCHPKSHRPQVGAWSSVRAHQSEMETSVWFPVEGASVSPR